MKKKLVSLLLASAMVASLTACGGNSSNSNDGTKGDASNNSNNSSKSGDSIRLVNGKIEIDATLKKLAEMYKEETGVEVQIESMGGGIDIQGTLKGYYQATICRISL